MYYTSKKVGIATVYTGYNYGSALQAYATKKILQKIGYNGELLKLKGSIFPGRDVRLKKLFIIGFRSLLHKGSLNNIKKYGNSMSKKMSAETISLFDLFIHDILKPKELPYSKLKRKSCTDEYIAFLCGSDQIWNASVFYVDPFYYLQFAPKSKRIAFAPSFGRENVPDYNRKTISKYLASIPHKSVREASGVDIVRDLTGDVAKVLLDPTLVLTPKEWKEGLKTKEIKNDKYIFAYFLDTPSTLAFQTVERISKQFGLKIINLPYCSENQTWQEISAGPKEFIELVSGASFVCTDSFHGTAFSLNFNVPFYTFERNYGEAEKQSTRIESLLNMVDLKSNYITAVPEIIEIEQDFTHANKVIDAERNRSYNYLNSTINSNGETDET